MEDSGTTEGPFILHGKYFKVIKTEGKLITAKCQNCPTDIKGSSNATSNFVTHLKVLFVHLVENYF